MNAYVTGFTTSTDFPVTTTNFTQWTTLNLTNYNADVFVTRFGPDGGTNGGYSITFGSRANDQGLGIAVDPNQFAYVTGYTAGRTNFADLEKTNMLPPGFSSTNTSFAGSGTRDVFIQQLDPGGSNVFTAYFGGSGNSQANGIALDTTSSTNVIAYIVGNTMSTNLPAAGSSRFHGSRLYPDAFVAQIDFTNSPTGP